MQLFSLSLGIFFGLKILIFVLSETYAGSHCQRGFYSHAWFRVVCSRSWEKIQRSAKINSFTGREIFFTLQDPSLDFLNIVFPKSVRSVASPIVLILALQGNTVQFLIHAISHGLYSIPGP